MSDIEPGWYPDPAEPTTQRYWDGEGWLGDPIPVDATPPETPPTPPTPAPEPAPQLSWPTAAEAGPPSGPAPGVEAAPTGPDGQPDRLEIPLVGPSGRPHASARQLLPAPRPHGFPVAPIPLRLVARLIDVLAVLLLNAVVNGWFIAQYLQETAPMFGEIWRWLEGGEEPQGPANPSRATYLQTTVIFLALALWFAYEVPATAGSGQTLGKRLVGIRVVGIDSPDPIGTRRAWRRWNPLGLPVLLWACYGFGFLLQALDLLVGVADQPLHQTLHDKSAGTVVVRVNRNGAKQ